MASIAQAIRMALHKAETQLGVEDIFGEDVGPPLGGVFTCTQGLTKSWNTPLDERGIIGMAIGLAMAGQKPVAEIQFCDYIFNTIDLLKLAGNTCWSSHGQFPLQMVIMSPVGTGIHGSIYHSHSFESMATHIPGLKVVLPSNPLDTYGLLISAVKDPNPVLFLYPKALIRVQGSEKIPGEPLDPKELSSRIDAPIENRKSWSPDWPMLEEHEVEIGKASLLRKGSSLTVISYGRTLPLCVQAADQLKTQGHSIEVIDLRTLIPWDESLVYKSVQKTGRVLIVNEDTEVTNFGEHLLRKINEHCFYFLQTPPKLLAGVNTPGIGLAWTLEQSQVPQLQSIQEHMKNLCELSA